MSRASKTTIFCTVGLVALSVSVAYSYAKKALWVELPVPRSEIVGIRYVRAVLPTRPGASREIEFEDYDGKNPGNAFLSCGFIPNPSKAVEVEHKFEVGKDYFVASCITAPPLAPKKQVGLEHKN